MIRYRPSDAALLHALRSWFLSGSATGVISVTARVQLHYRVIEKRSRSAATKEGPPALPCLYSPFSQNPCLSWLYASKVDTAFMKNALSQLSMPQTAMILEPRFRATPREGGRSRWTAELLHVASFEFCLLRASGFFDLSMFTKRRNGQARAGAPQLTRTGNERATARRRALGGEGKKD